MTRLHHATTTIVDCRSNNNKEIEVAHDQAEHGDCTDNSKHSQDVKWPFATILNTRVLRIVAKGHLTKVKNEGGLLPLLGGPAINT